MPNPAIREFISERQWEVLCAVEKAGSQRAASFELGIAHQTVMDTMKRIKARAAKQGLSPEHDLIHVVAPGFSLKGTSTLYDAETGEAKLQWVKTAVDREQQEDIIREMVEDFKAEIPKVRALKGPSKTVDDLLVDYLVSDHHLGMLAWGQETGGDDYDIDIAEKLLLDAMQYLVTTTPDSSRAVITILGDFFHYDSFVPETPRSKHKLDADSRFPKMVRVARRAVRFLVQIALKKHAKVHVIVEKGNHDPASAIWLMELLDAQYEKEPRVTVDRSPRLFHCFTFGKNLIGTHHGHSVKLQDLPLLFATDWPEEWGQTRHRVIHTGHVHHDQVKEFRGVTVETHRVLPPPDAYTADAGYRSKQGMKAVVYHTEHGEVSRHSVSPEMLK